MSARSARLRLLLTTDAVGGVWQYATDLARALGGLGVETLLAVLGPKLVAEQRALARSIAGLTLVETDLPLDWLADTPEQIAIAGRRIAELAKHVRADLVQLNHPAFAAQAAFPMPLIAVAHSCVATWWASVERGDLPEDLAWRAALHGQGLRAAARVVTPTAAFAAATQQTYTLGTPPTFIHNGRATPVGLTAAQQDFAFTAGRLWDRGKNVATLDRAAAALSVPFRAAGALVGPHGERASVSHLQTSGVLNERAVRDCLAARPVFVSAARYEPFGLAVLEAAAAGCALVLADIPTFRELWEGAAIFVAPDDDRGFAQAIESLIADPAARSARGEIAQSVARSFSVDRMAGRMRALYDDMLGTASIAPRAAA